MNALRNHLPTAARLFLGLVFTVFGLNFFLHFLPMPSAPPQAAAFAGALFARGHLFPLALAVLAPIVINIIGFHLFLEPSGLPIPLAVLAAELYLAWSYRGAFA